MATAEAHQRSIQIIRGPNYVKLRELFPTILLRSILACFRAVFIIDYKKFTNLPHIRINKLFSKLF